MGRADQQGGWCILTTNSVRTMALAGALSDAGMVAWTPMRTQRRAGRGKKRKEIVHVPTPITPTFVFVRSEHLPQLLSVLRMPVSPYPAFRLLREHDRIPIMSDASLDPLRNVEERFRRSMLKSTKVGLTVGTAVRMKTGGFAGMTGTVKMGRKKRPVIDLGGLFGELDIASYLIGTDVVRADHQPAMGITA